MKTILLLRHAKSSHKDIQLSDHDRPLNDRGRRDAPRMGRWLAGQSLVPDAVLCSTAVRARATAEAVLAAAGFDGAVHFTEDLYPTAAETVIGLLGGLPPSVERALVVGHNPGMETLLDRLSGMDEVMPTTALAHVELPIATWSEIGRETAGRLVNLWRPRELDEMG